MNWYAVAGTLIVLLVLSFFMPVDPFVAIVTALIVGYWNRNKGSY